MQQAKFTGPVNCQDIRPILLNSLLKTFDWDIMKIYLSRNQVVQSDFLYTSSENNFWTGNCRTDPKWFNI